MVEIFTIKAMENAGMWPIREPLLNVPDNYVLAIDSMMNEVYNPTKIIQWAAFKEIQTAPPPSDRSDDNVDLFYDSGADDDKKMMVQVNKEDPFNRFKGINKKVFELNNFDLEVMVDFPFKFKEAEVPYSILKDQDLTKFIHIQEGIGKMYGVTDIVEMKQQFKYKFWGMAEIQLLFEYFCLTFKAAAPRIDRFLTMQLDGWWKLSFRNYTLNEPTTKALACLIPFMVHLDEVEFHTNQMQDMVGAAVALGIFMNPSIKNVIINGNYCKSSFFITLTTLMKYQPEKLFQLSLLGSIQFADSLEKMVRNVHVNRMLTDLNLAGNVFSLLTCRLLSTYMIYHGPHLQDLNISHCNIAHQGTRYVIDALNRNTSVRFFNFAQNDMTSSSYEFSIKLGAIVTRHPNLMHLDISCVGLKREEVLFMGLALYMSKTALALHLSGNTLPYYDRMFLRTLAAARVTYKFKNDAKTDEIKNNKEYTHIMHLGSRKNYNQEINRYIDTYNQLDSQRKGLEFELEEMLTDLDTEAEFKELNKRFTSMDDVPKDSKIGMLVGKIKERNLSLHSQRQMCLKALEDKKNMKELMEQAKEIGDGVKELATDKDGNTIEIEKTSNTNSKKRTGKKSKPPTEDAQMEAGGDIFEQAAQFKVERQKQRAEQELIKEKDRSQGELALMFMGINQIANQLLNENPMTGYMNHIIFTRVLGHEDTQEGHYWTDANQCWICCKWNKIEIAFHPIKDRREFTMKVQNLEDLKYNCVHAVRESLKEDGIWDDVIDDLDELKEMGMQMDKDIQKMGHPGQELPNIEEDEDEDEDVPEFISEKLEMLGENSDSTCEVEGHISGLLKQLQPQVPEELRHLTLNSQDAIAPVKATHEQVKKAMNQVEIDNMNKFDKMHLEHQGDFMEGPLKRGLLIPREINFASKKTKIRPLQNTKLLPPSFTLAGQGGSPQRTFSRGSQDSRKSGMSNRIKKVEAEGKEVEVSTMDAQTRSIVVYSELTTDQDTMRTSTLKVKRRVRGQPVLVEREVFFKGMVYIIEEEVYSDSDRSSIYTSEDEFEVSKDLNLEFANSFPILDKQTASKADQEWQQYTIKLEQEDDTAQQGIIQWPRELVESHINPIVKEQPYLTQAQREYQNKLLPRHYIEKQKQMRVKKFNTTEFESASKQLAKKKRRMKRRLQEKLETEVAKPPELRDDKLIDKFRSQMEEAMNDIEETLGADANGDIYLLASCNDWLPVKMKTKRVLALEKINMQEPAPSTILNNDNVQLIFATFIAPGPHYFYFVQGNNRVFLSPNYQVVRFKETNVFLNRIILKPKKHVFDTVFVLKEGFEDEELFLIDHSVFSKYEVEQLPARTRLLRKCFDTDLTYAKIARVCKNVDQEVRAVEMKLWEHFPRLQNIWLYEIRRDDQGVFGWIDCTTYMKMKGVIDEETLHTDQFDRAFISTNVNYHGFINSAERNLNRYEWLEMIVRLARIKYVETAMIKSTAMAIEKLLSDELYPSVLESDGWNFRQRNCYNVKVNELLRRNMPVLEQIYKAKGSPIITHAKKKHISLAEAKLYIHGMHLKPPPSDYVIGAAFYESLLSIVDTIRTKRMLEMQPWEFIVFICRITYQYYEKTVYWKEAMHIKLEKFLPKWLDPIYQQPIFTFNEEFEYDKKQAKKKERARKKLLGIDDEDDAEEDSDEDGDDEESEAALEEIKKQEEEAKKEAEEAAIRQKEQKEAAAEEELERAMRGSAGRTDDFSSSESESDNSERMPKGGKLTQFATSQSDGEPKITQGMPAYFLKRVSKKMFEVLDSNTDGILELVEFRQLVAQMAHAAGHNDFVINGMKAPGNTMWSALFQTYAFNKDGNVAWQDVWEFLKQNRP